MKNWFLATLSMLISFSATSETVSSKDSVSQKKNVITAALPKCISDNQHIDSIKSTIKANSKTAFKYDGYRKALASDSDEELLARLIYAETKGANCSELNDKVSSVITTVISNRIKIKKGNVKAVLFERDQFSSSLNIYSESQYKEFLCPSDATLWEMSLRKATTALSDKSKPSTTVNYFLYKHSPRWSKEPWKLEEDTAMNGSKTRDCIKAFKNPRYK